MPSLYRVSHEGESQPRALEMTICYSYKFLKPDFWAALAGDRSSESVNAIAFVSPNSRILTVACLVRRTLSFANKLENNLGAIWHAIKYDTTS